jgi:hypothetical protein
MNYPNDLGRLDSRFMSEIKANLDLAFWGLDAHREGDRLGGGALAVAGTDASV